MMSKPDARTIEDRLVRRISELRGIPEGDIDVEAPVSNSGIDSASALVLVGELEDWLGCELDATLFFDHPTLRTASVHIAKTLPS